MDLKQLEYFVRVAELGSFTRAASLLGIAQPALSRQVRLLEVELRQNLLLRNGRGVTMTDAGKRLLEHSRGILHQVERAREDMGRVPGELAGRVTVGLPPSMARLLTVPLTREFRQRLPGAALSVSEGLSVALQEGLQTGRLDIALLYNAQPSADTELWPLANEALFLVSPASAKTTGNPIALHDVAPLPLVMPARPSAIRMLVESQLALIGCRPRVALEIDGIAAILDLVADGAGHAILPQHALRTTPHAYRQRRIIKPRLHSQLSLAVSSRRTSTRTQQAMLELIKKVCAEVLVTERGGADGATRR